ncbi:MAG: hypothetical protein Kow0025_23390 [Thermodesulfovibrionales bacterium]
MLCSLATLNDESLREIRAFEKKTGRVLLAYTCKEIGIDRMSEAELSELKKLEDKLRLQLVAVR